MEIQSKINRANLLKQQQETTNQINALLEKSAQAIMCGPTCQKMKKTQELEQAYLNAQTNMQTAPIQVEQTRKTYYEFTEGSGAYNTMLEQDLQKKADEIGKVITNSFKEEVQRANVMNSYLNSEIINSQNTLELYENYLSKNKNTEKKIKSSYGDVLTNDRKSYYETQQMEGLIFWHTFLFVVYYILFVGCLIGIFFSSNDFSFIQKIGITIILFAYPYIINFVSSFCVGLMQKLKDMLPKDVYNQ